MIATQHITTGHMALTVSVTEPAALRQIAKYVEEFVAQYAPIHYSWIAPEVVHRAAKRFGCGVMVDDGITTATAGHVPAGGWSVKVDGHPVELGSDQVFTVIRPRVGRYRTIAVCGGSAASADSLVGVVNRRPLVALENLLFSGASAILVDERGDVVEIGAWPHLACAAIEAPHAA